MALGSPPLLSPGCEEKAGPGRALSAHFKVNTALAWAVLFP